MGAVSWDGAQAVPYAGSLASRAALMGSLYTREALTQWDDGDQKVHTGHFRTRSLRGYGSPRPVGPRNDRGAKGAAPAVPLCHPETGAHTGREDPFLSSILLHEKGDRYAVDAV